MRSNNVSRLLFLGSVFAAGGLGCGSETPSPSPGSGGSSSGIGGAAASGSGGTGMTPGVGGTTTTGTGATGGVATGGTGGIGSGGIGQTGGTGGIPPGVGGTGTGGGATGGTGGGGEPVTCNISVTSSEISSAISTVGIVEWSTDLAGLSGANIEFGLDTSYGMAAPVDLNEPGYRTLLLGMKAQREYHYRIVANAGNQRCESQDFTIMTGSLPNNLPDKSINTPNPGALAGGFLLTGRWQGGPAFILDADGDYVWWHPVPELGRARMSYDGKYMWIRNTNVQGGMSRFIRVKMDGTEEELHSEFGNSHHDFTVLPDESIAFISHDGCDTIKLRTPDGNVRDIIDVQQAHGGTSMCHANSIHYDPADQTLTFSDLYQDAYTKITLDGEVVWVLGGSTSDFSGDVTWNAQHGHHNLPNNHLLFFNNVVSAGPGGGQGNSLAIELELDLNTMTATKVWEYDGGSASNVMGDVQRLHNGNTLITYSAAGVIHEVDANRNMVQSISFGLGAALGYAMKRQSLYGPPPK